MARAGSPSRCASSTTASRPTARWPCVHRVGRARARPASSRPSTCTPFAQGLPPQHQTMIELLLRRSAARSGVDVRASALARLRHSGPRTSTSRSSTTRSRPLIPLSLEGYGFCGRGEGAAFTEDGALERRRAAADQHLGRRPVRGVRARLQPDHRGRAADARHLDLPGRGRRDVPGDERRGRADERAPAGGRRWNPDCLLPISRTTTRAPFWAARRAASCSCSAARTCDRLRIPPRPMCPSCRSIRHEWVPVSGRGTVWSFVVPHPPLLPAYAAVAPYNVIIVALDDDPGAPARRQPRRERGRPDQRGRPGDDSHRRAGPRGLSAGRGRPPATLDAA